MKSRRNFINKLFAGTTLFSFLPFLKSEAKESAKQQVFVHHVFFWLKNPQSKEDCKAFENGVQALLKVPQIKSTHVGKPVMSDRDVVDDSFTYSYMVTFDSPADQNIYQTHPIHLKFIEDCSHLWERVIVYDAMN